MSLGITNLSMAEILLGAHAEEICGQEGNESELPEMKGELKGASKHYTLSSKSHLPETKKTEGFTAKLNLSRHTPHKEMEAKPSLMQMISQSSKQADQSTSRAKADQQTGQKKTESESKKSEESPKPQPSLPRSLPPTSFSKEQTTQKKEFSKSSEAHSTKETKSLEKHTKEGGSLATREWRKEETKEWWQERYHQQKERQGGGQEKNQDQPSKEKEEKRLRISKSSSIKGKCSSDLTSQENTPKITKPFLSPPKMGLFALYYILTKIGIFSDGTSNFAYKKEIEYYDLQANEVHKKRMDEIKEGLRKEKENVRWSIALKAFSWIGSCSAIIAGISLIASGVGAVAGAMLVVGGTIHMANNIMEATSGWQKVAEILPGDDTEKKRAVVHWIQIGVSVLCLALLGVNAIWGGYAQLSEAMRTGMNLIGGIAGIGQGISTIGEGVTTFFFNEKQTMVKQHEIRLAELNHFRKDLLERVDWGVNRLEQLFEDLAKALDFEVELFQADQMVNRR